MQPQFVLDAFGGQFGGKQDDRQARPRMGAGPGEVQVAVARMPVVRAQIAYLQEVVAQAECRTFGQVELLLVLRRAQGLLEDDPVS